MRCVTLNMQEEVRSHTRLQAVVQVKYFPFLFLIFLMLTSDLSFWPSACIYFKKRSMSDSYSFQKHFKGCAEDFSCGIFVFQIASTAVTWLRYVLEKLNKVRICEKAYVLQGLRGDEQNETIYIWDEGERIEPWLKPGAQRCTKVHDSQIRRISNLSAWTSDTMADI